MQESILNKPIEWSNDSLLVHVECRRVQGQVELNSAVSGAQVSRPDMQAPHQAKRTGVTEHIVPPSGCVRMLGDASGLRCWLAPCSSGSAKVGPTMVRQQLAEGWEVLRISIDVANDEGGSFPSQALVTDDGLKNRVGRSCSAGVAM